MDIAVNQNAGDDFASGQVSRGTLIGLTIAIAIIAYISVSSGIPSFVAPFPLLVIIPWFFGVPPVLVPMVPACVFAVCHFRHWKCKPRAQPAIGLSILLWIATALVPLFLIAGWSYGIQYQGFVHTVFVVIANAIFAVVVWTTWWLARTPKNYQMQIAFGFALFAWLSSFAFPWMGEI